MRFIRNLALALVLVGPTLPAIAAHAAQPPKPAQEEFVPLSEVPPEEQLPAVPLVVVAYAFVWIAALFYAWTIAKRLRKVEKEISQLEQRKR